jgi:3-phenylpropionate/trans-cinnamate dioxygenase ferredoxin subunit
VHEPGLTNAPDELMRDALSPWPKKGVMSPAMSASGHALCEGPLIRLAQSSVPGEIGYTRLGEIIRCPWHGWEFDIRTGQSYCDPKRFRAKAYPVSVEPGSNVVKGPYVAETIKVAVESDYVVVDL